MSIINRLTNKNHRRKLPNAMIVVERTKKRVFRYVPVKYIPSNSFVKLYGGAWMHILGLSKDGKFWPIERAEAIEGRMPTDLYMAKNCADEVNDVYGMSLPTIEKIKISVFVGLCVAILVVIFLMVFGAGGD
ncbi:hypothetical protein ES703_20767 [subsurface metagenome]